MVKAVIFDMDGVLVDNRDVHLEALEILTRRYGVEFDTSDMTWAYGKGNDSIIQGIFPPEVIEKTGIQNLARENGAIYRDIYSDRITPARGLSTFLHDLHRHGIKCAVGSSAGKTNVDYVLEKCGLEDDFDVVVTGDMVARRKPDPGIFLLAADLLGLVPRECVVIEDSEAGLQAADAAGMPAIGVATTHPRELIEKLPHKMIIDNFEGLTYAKIKGLEK